MLAELCCCCLSIAAVAVGIAPVAVNDWATTPAGRSILINVAANDADEGNNAGFFVDAITQGPSAGTGTAVLQADQRQVQYTPPSTSWMGTATFQYSITDYNDGLKATGTVTVTVAAPPPVLNRRPVAVGDTATTVQNVAVTIIPLSNDMDPDGDPLTLSGMTITTRGGGTATVDPFTKSIRYTPNPSFVGQDIMSYRVWDGRGGTATATVTITVTGPPPPQANRRPVAVGDTATTLQNVAVTINPLSNDSDPDGDLLTLSGMTITTRGGGTATVDPFTKSIRYTPNPSFVGQDFMSYRIWDGRGGTATAAVIITVTVPPPPQANRAPIAVGDTATTLQNVAVTINPLSNDSDPDGDPLTLAGMSITTRGNGFATVDPFARTIRYTPNPSFVGQDFVSYRVWDGRGGTARAVVTITVGT